MLPKIIRENCVIRVLCYPLLVVLIMCALPAYSQQINVNQVNAQSMLEALTSQIPNLMSMVTAIAYVMGMFFIFSGILRLKEYGEARTQMSYDKSLKGPLILLSVGAFLLYLPTSVDVGMSTFWASPAPYGYMQKQDQWTDFINDCFVIIQFIGTIAFIRGLVILSHLGGHGGQPGTFSKGLTHIIGGIFCINIYQFVQVIMVTFGIQ